MNTQQIMPLGMQVVPDIEELPIEEVLACPTIQAALRLSLRRANTHRTDEGWAAALGVSNGAFNQIINKDLRHDKRVRHIPDNWFTEVARLTGNNAVGQWMYLYPRRALLNEQIERKKQEIEQLQMEIA